MTAEADDGRLIDDDPKSQARRRRVAFPREIAHELRWHLERFAQPGKDGVVFIGPRDGRLRRSRFRQTWAKARNAVGLLDLHFHALRHAGNTMAAGQGASLRELRNVRGHSSSCAALICQHATQERDEAIAAGMGKLLRQARRKAKRTGERARIFNRPRNGHAAGNAPREDCLESGGHASSPKPGTARAGEGNRNLMTSLEGCGGDPADQRVSSLGG